MLFLTFCIFLTVNGLHIENVNDFDIPSNNDFIDLISRDIESMPSLAAFGEKHISGGAGEGLQKLLDKDDFQSRQEVKTDSVLPAYCEPPNPCPVGFTSEQGCIEDFENSAEFSRNYQAQQHCLCDQEHMFNCVDKEAEAVGDSLQKLLEDNGIHENTIAKKFHEKRGSDEYQPRRKRDGYSHQKINPYLMGEPLRTVEKKNGLNIH